ncbi:TPA: hypothetical protein MD835_003827 [Klebsiella pneumoniae]|nr:hypothetical protein [Klebsiella pneumoniae]HBV8876753.1 hypothetical protein [Klebsiella pneumoniae]
MFNPSAALFANTMLMFRLMFFHIKKPAEAGFIMLQCLFSGTSTSNRLSSSCRRLQAYSKEESITSPPAGRLDMHCPPDQAHCFWCRHFYGHLPVGISYSRNQGTPQSAYRSRSRVGMCGTNNQAFARLPESIYPVQ